MKRKADMTTSHRRSVATAVLAAAMLATTGSPPVAATHQSVSAVNGTAFGYWADEISLFGGALSDTGPVPAVTLVPDGSNSPQTATAATGRVSYGPAILFSSNRIDVSSSGGAGSVTSSTTIDDVNTSRAEIFGEDNYNPTPTPGLERPLTDVASTCTASVAGVSGTTTITNGSLYLDSGWNDGDLLYPEPAALAEGLAEHDPVKMAVATSPAPGTTHAGHIHLSADSTDRYEVVFNEHVTNADGSLTVNAVHEYFGVVRDGQGNRVTDGPSVLKGHLYLGRSVCGVTQAAAPHPNPVADFDGDRDTDRSVFRDGAWYAEGQPTAFFGVAGDIPVPGDYDGDGDTDRAVYRAGAWLTDGQPTAFLGVSGDVPVPGDYDGNGTTDRAVFRPSVGAWYIEGQPTIYHGAPGDIPVPGDYDGNRSTDVAIWRSSVGGWYVAGQATVFLGLNGDIPIPGDYDGNSATDRGIWRPSVGGWYIQNQPNVFVGLDGDIPAPGDYDGDGDTERGIWRPSVGGWYVEGQVTAFLGLNGDVPLPLPQAIYRVFF